MLNEGTKKDSNTWITSALPLATPEATVPIPASATSFTDTLAFGLICLISTISKSYIYRMGIFYDLIGFLPDEGHKLTVQDLL